MAVVILGGLVTSTVLNLFLMPALYLAFGHGGRRPDEDEEGPGVVERAEPRARELVGASA